VQTRYETDHDLRDLHNATGQDREISLGTTTILGIFFALALLCAVFFGFGYSMGRRSAQAATNPTELTTRTDANTAKPAPGSPAAVKQSGATQSAVVPVDSPDSAAQDDQAATPIDTVKPAALTPRSDATHQAVPPAMPLSAMPISTAAPSPGSSVVQVAAMSHQEDADVVAVDLKRRGYTVAIRRESQDKLFHVQIGPFSTKKEADAMRLRLQTDGYNNAIVK
jgi:cell division septation protein DedD